MTLGSLSTLLVLFSLSAPNAWANDAAYEFKVKKDYYSTRFDGYFEHYLEKERAEEERKKGAGQMRDMRRQQIEADEKARREFVQKRQSKPVQDDTRWKIEIQERERMREQQRQDYVRRQRDLAEFIRRYNYIPADEELDIDVLYFEE